MSKKVGENRKTAAQTAMKPLKIAEYRNIMKRRSRTEKTGGNHVRH